MEQDPGVLIVGQPTRGVDVGAIEFIHNRLIEMRDRGKAVLLISVELDEIRSLSDRILVMFAGRIVGERGPDADRRRARPADGRRRAEGGRRMSTPYAKLPAWADYGLIPLVNLLVAFVVAGLVVLLVGENPLRAAVILFDGAFGSGQNIGFTLYYATNFIFTGLAVAVAFHAACSTSAARARPISPASASRSSRSASTASLPWWLTFPLAIVGAALVGALWALIPAYLQAKRGSHIVITTIMFNFIAASLMVYLLVDVLKPAGEMAPQTRTFLAGGQLPKLNFILEALGPFGALGAAQRLLPAGAGHGLAGLAADLAHQARLRDPHHGPQPDGGALRRHRRDPHHHHHHDDLRRAGRHDGAQPDHGRPAPHGRSISSPAPASSASRWR